MSNHSIIGVRLIKFNFFVNNEKDVLDSNCVVFHKIALIEVCIKLTGNTED